MQQALSGIPEYSSSPPIESGRVVAADGRAVAGATVLLYPDPFTPAKGTVIRPEARAVSDAAGTYVLHLPTALDPQLVNARSEGALDLHIMAAYPGGTANLFVPVPAGRHAASAVARLNLVQGPQFSMSASSARPDGDGACDPITSPNYTHSSSVIVGYKSSADSDLKGASFTYSTSDSATTEDAWSASDSFGGLQSAGTSTESTGGSQTYKNMPGSGSNDLLGVDVFDWQEYQCITGDQWYLSTYTIEGSDGTPGASAVAAGDCISTTNLSSYTVNSGTQEQWSTGLNLEALGAGFNGSSQDGYATSSSLTYTFNSGDYPPMCGVDGDPETPNERYVQAH
jgi:hypothetical protein